MPRTSSTRFSPPRRSTPSSPRSTSTASTSRRPTAAPTTRRPAVGRGANPATYFDALVLQLPGSRRLLLVDNTTVFNVVNTQVPAWDLILVIVNSTVYGGAGGAVGMFSLATGANEIGMHELGQPRSGSPTSTSTGRAAAWTRTATTLRRRARRAERHDRPEPATIKWRDLIVAATPLPTTNNADCTVMRPAVEPVPGRDRRCLRGRALLPLRLPTARSSTAGCGRSASPSAPCAVG